MSKKIFAKVKQFHEDGFRPSILKNGGVILREHGRTNVKLAKANGEKTPAGRFYEQHSGDRLPDGALDSGQVPVRVRDSEFITVRGKRRVTRTWDPVKHDWRFSALGNNFYKHMLRNYVCQIPVVVHGTRDNGTEYTIHTYFPMTKLGVDTQQLPLNLTEAQRLARVKQIVTQTLPAGGVIYEVSRES